MSYHLGSASWKRTIQPSTAQLSPWHQPACQNSPGSRVVQLLLVAGVWSDPWCMYNCCGEGKRRACFVYIFPSGSLVKSVLSTLIALALVSLEVLVPRGRPLQAIVTICSLLAAFTNRSGSRDRSDHTDRNNWPWQQDEVMLYCIMGGRSDIFNTLPHPT